MDAIKTIASTAIEAGADGLKKALNVTLKPCFRAGAAIVTNQDGLNYLDTLKDKNDQYLLKPELADATKYTFAGFPVKVFDNDTIPSNTATGGKRGIPFIIGDLKEAVVMFERKGINIVSSAVAGDAFAKDMTYFRAIEREVVKVRDAAAVVNGVMTVDVA
jgi:HK97 family phage major capsid protein